MTTSSSEGSHVYCTKSHRTILPPDLRSQFRDLDHFIRELVTSAHKCLIIVAPYLSPGGMEKLRDSIAISAKRCSWIRIVTGELEDPKGWNRRSLRTLLEGASGDHIRRRLRVLTPSPELCGLFHAKVIIVDNQRGYLGSANFSESALERNFEVGVSISPRRAQSLGRMIEYLDARGLLKDMTDLVKN